MMRVAAGFSPRAVFFRPAMANPHVGVNVADLEATLSRYNAHKNELETTMNSIAAIAGGLEALEQNSEVQKLEDALATCARAMQSVKNEVTALKEAKAMLPQVSLSHLLLLFFFYLLCLLLSLLLECFVSFK